MRKRPGEARKNRHSGERGERVDRVRGERETRALSEEDLDEILEGAEVPLLLVLDCVQDPNNLGAILRTADGAGVHAVIAPKDKAVGLTDTVRRVSVGAWESVPFVKERGIWLVGTSDRATQSLYETDLKGPTAIVMGREGEGMRRLTEEECDFLIQFPMKGKVDCLNVSVASGVCLYEAVRQREPGS